MSNTLTSRNSLESLDTIHTASNHKLSYFSLAKAAQKLGLDIAKIPYATRILLENLLRKEDGVVVTEADISKFAGQCRQKYEKNANNKGASEISEILFYPARILMQDFTGVPAIVDLASMRDAMRKMNKNPEKVNPLIPVDLVVDHSVQVDYYGNAKAEEQNIAVEFSRNKERYAFLKWAQSSFNRFKVVPPGTGICHQVNLEYLASVVQQEQLDDGRVLAYPDSVFGTDSHTTMINGLGVLGWGVGGIEAEAAMLGQPFSMLLPKVVGVHLSGTLPAGINATDLVLTITELLRKHGVVDKFVEFFGTGLTKLSLADRATIANMCPEYGATCAFFPVDGETINYLEFTNRSAYNIDAVNSYCQAQKLFHYPEEAKKIVYDELIQLDLQTVRRVVAGPKRPQDKIFLEDVAYNFQDNLASLNKNPENQDKTYYTAENKLPLSNGTIVMAAITSCTNTSNPFVLIGAGLLAKKAIKAGLKVKPWVKTSLAPGSKVVTSYLQESGLDKYLQQLGFFNVGYGCTTCIGNSGPLNQEIEDVIQQNSLVVASVLSGNRNFEGRIHPHIRANYLASPLLCVAYALVGNIRVDLDKINLAEPGAENPVYLRDIWPSDEEIRALMVAHVSPEMFAQRYADVFMGDANWRSLATSKTLNYDWDNSSAYIKNPPYFESMTNVRPKGPRNLMETPARILAILGDSITTDHISPAGNIANDSPAAVYLRSFNIEKRDFNSYGARRGNHEVMMRGTFANVRIKNKMLDNIEGGKTKYYPSGEVMSIYDAAMRYKNEGRPLVIFAGQEYGTGSSRDWAAKGTRLLGVKAVIAEGFERIHRSNLVGMGIIPMLYNGKVEALGLKGSEIIDIRLDLEQLMPNQNVKCTIMRENGEKIDISLIANVRTELELDYIKAGGILEYMLYKM